MSYRDSAAASERCECSGVVTRLQREDWCRFLGDEKRRGVWSGLGRASILDGGFIGNARNLNEREMAYGCYGVWCRKSARALSTITCDSAEWANTQ